MVLHILPVTDEAPLLGLFYFMMKNYSKITLDNRQAGSLRRTTEGVNGGGRLQLYLNGTFAGRGNQLVNRI